MLYRLVNHALKTKGFDSQLPQHLWARRCVFTHRQHSNSKMMVTEVMLPAVYELRELKKSLSYDRP